jgi:Abnormal spindle-like microcephaly-assoc'd, ASPM-SPD-2-Hydin/Concanavalin A-like lectin/glucanases superfamily
MATSTNPLQIGGDSFHTQFFNGTIDEVRLYNVALNETQIQSDMNTPVSSGSSLPLVSFGTPSLTFGTQATGSTSAAQQVTLTNAGGGTLSVSGIAIAGGNAADFGETNNCPASLAPNGACTVNVTFAPLDTGAFNSFVQITDNAPGSPQTVALSGTGTGFGVTPSVSVLTFTGQQQFSAGSGSITWSVDGTVGGSSTSGTITTGGLYTPPSTVGTHLVTATTSTQSASATVYVSGFAGDYTFHNDNMRSGQNLNETVLTVNNVNDGQFGQLFSYSLDGLAFASPLYVASVNIPSQGYHNVVYVATEHDSVYAFDADGLSTTPLWKTSFLSTNVTSVPCGSHCSDIPTEYGVTGTPVIDPTSNTLYVVAATLVGGTTYTQSLHALDITTGAEKFGGPVVIQASVSGTASDSEDGVLTFNPFQQNQRPALLLSNGVVYISWGSHEDSPPWHGWMIGYNATTLARTMVYCSTPNGLDGGFWATGGPGTDSTGDLFVTSGNGDFTGNTGGTDYADSLLKIGTNGSLVDYFTPYNQAAMETGNLDFSSSGPTLLINQPGTYPHLLVAAAKLGTIFVLNRDNLGQYNANNNDQVVQSLISILPNGTQETGNYSAPVYFNGYVYFGAVSDNLKAFQLTNGLLSGGPTSQSPEIYPNRGGSFSVSANGSSNGIVWAVQDNSPSNGVLYAYNAANLSNELYNTNQVASRDALGVAQKMNVPVVANGKVFVIANAKLVVYGLLP